MLSAICISYSFLVILVEYGPVCFTGGYFSPLVLASRLAIFVIERVLRTYEDTMYTCQSDELVAFSAYRCRLFLRVPRKVIPRRCGKKYFVV